MIHGFREGVPTAKLITHELGMDVHVPEGAKGVVYGPNGPLADAEATSLFATSAHNAFTPPSGVPADASIASLLIPTLKPDPRLVALARTAEIGAGVELEGMCAKYAGFEQGFKGTDGFPEGGYGEVMKNLVADIKAAGGEVHLDTEVTKIEDLGAGKGVRLATKDGGRYTAKVIISTIPHAVLQHSPPTFQPPLSPLYTSAIERMRTGSLEKVVLSYPSAWWPSPEENGSFLLLPLQDPSVPLTEVKPTSLRDVLARTVIPVSSFQRIASTSHPTLLAYMGAASARYISSFAPDEVASAFHDYLVERLSPSSPPPAPTVKLVTNWQCDPFSLGATSTPVPLTQSRDGERASPLDFVIASRPTWDGRLGFAGEHTDLDNHGSVAGAAISGKREGLRVKELLERLAEQEANEHGKAVL
ncbi:flavin containing amine oxidase [Rhodotorula toruloides]|uniref:Flavin containing amine oxidase n=1 Tax=Rhodotorula toruloides TaxID=5286 RepID=A0A511KFX6_RHOTO|nr:flavin containing amine oxidase [Rhodotorula toruloides]